MLIGQPEQNREKLTREFFSCATRQTREKLKRDGRNAFGEKNSGEVDALGNVLYRSEKEKLSRYLRCLAEAGGPSSNNLEGKNRMMYDCCAFSHPAIQGSN